MEQRDMIDAIFRASALTLKLNIPKPPFKKGSWHDCRLTVSIQHPQRKGQIRLLTSETTQLGTSKIVEGYKSLLIPSVFIIKDLPTKDKEQDFHKLR